MTQPGGPAAINGFLYQILQHLSWMVDVRLSGRLVGQDVKDAYLMRISQQSCHPLHGKAATHFTRKLPPITRQSCHPQGGR